MKLEVECPACRRKIVLVMRDASEHVRAVCERPRDNYATATRWDDAHPDSGGEYVFVPEDGNLLAL